MSNSLILQLVGLDPAYLSSLSLVICRIAGLVATAPGWSATSLSWRIRAASVPAIALLVWPIAGSDPIPHPNVLALLALGALEFSVGAGMGLTTGLVLAAARQAGEIAGLLAGLAPSAFLDPDTHTELTPLGQLHAFLALAVFLTLDGPFRIVTALAQSYEPLPLALGMDHLNSTPSSLAIIVQQAFARVAWALELAVRLAAPAAMSLTVSTLAIGLVGRLVPQSPAQFVAQPIRSLIGLAVVTVGLAATASALGSSWDSILATPWLAPE